MIFLPSKWLFSNYNSIISIVKIIPSVFSMMFLILVRKLVTTSAPRKMGKSLEMIIKRCRRLKLKKNPLNVITFVMVGLTKDVRWIKSDHCIMVHINYRQGRRQRRDGLLDSVFHPTIKREDFMTNTQRTPISLADISFPCCIQL